MASKMPKPDRSLALKDRLANIALLSLDLCPTGLSAQVSRTIVSFIDPALKH
ncbi:MAG: hypothetical protein MO847_06070 [Candidatus Protistobacter heckmanni]|nr:hypothetical protein [Candidatus Protistobacter heckmanni]